MTTGNKMSTLNDFLGSFLIMLLSLAPQAAFAESQAKPLNDYSKSDHLWLTMEEGIIEPSQNKDYSSTTEDHITFLKKHGSHLSKGTPWAIINKEDLDLSERKIVLERSKAKKELSNMLLKQENESDKKALAIQSIKSKKQQFIDALTDDSIPKNLKEKIQDAILKMDSKIAAHEALLTPEALAVELENAKEDLLIELERKEINFKKIKKRAVLKAEFDGTLEIHVENASTAHEQTKGYWPAPSTQYASITDNSHYNLKISTRNSALNIEDPARLSAKLQDIGHRSMVTAQYSGRGSSKKSSGIKEFHLFKLEKNQADFAENNLGELRSVYVYYKLDSPCHILPKKNIAFLAPEVLEKRGWQGLVSHLYPGAKLVRSGPTTLAVKAPDGN